MRRALTTLVTALAGAVAAVVLVRAHERALDAAAGPADDDVSPETVEVARVVSLARASGIEVEDWHVPVLEEWIRDGATSDLIVTTSDGDLIRYPARPL